MTWLNCEKATIVADFVGAGHKQQTNSGCDPRLKTRDLASLGLFISNAKSWNLEL
jgi:hypothetical protein